MPSATRFLCSDIRKMMPWVVCCFFSLGAVRDPFLVFNRCTLWCAFKWKATLLLCICRPVSCKKKFHIFFKWKVFVGGGVLVKRFVCIAWFHTHQNSSLSLSPSLLVSHHIIPIHESETLQKKNFDSVSRNSQQHRNSQHKQSAGRRVNSSDFAEP